MEEHESAGYWKTQLFVLQESAPKPKPIFCANPIAIGQRPPFYGNEFHAFLERDAAEKMLLAAGNGAFLVRASKRSADAFTLSMNFDRNILNYKLYYDGAHYVGEKRFESIEQLVQDGLICMHVEKHASDYIKNMAESAIYELSPYYNHSVEPAITGKKRQIRCHNFAPVTFKMPQYCDFCRNFLWGLVQQGVRCLDCGFSAHKKCSEKARHDCLPEAKYIKRTFAVDLSTLCLAHDVQVPPVIMDCIREVESRGLNVEGIYRVSGSHERMENLRRLFDMQIQVNLAQEEDIHNVAGLLKLYLRLLPQQLVPFSTYTTLLGAFTGNKDGERTRNCRSALAELNDANRHTLQVLLTHLKRVSEHSDSNKMTIENLATIFSPTIFCTGNSAFPALPNQQHQLLHYLIVSKNLIQSS